MSDTATEKYTDILLERLHSSPTNPRTDLEIDDDFVASIKSSGIVQPLIVRPIADGYEIAAGHRRRAGAEKAGLVVVPCIIRTLSDDQMIDIHIVENIQRADLSPMAEARTYKLLRDRGATLAQVAERAGKSEGYVNRRLSLNNLIPTLQTDLDNGLPIEYGFELAKYPADMQAELEPRMYPTKHVLKGVDVTDGYVLLVCDNVECVKEEIITDFDTLDTDEPRPCECGGEMVEEENEPEGLEQIPDRTKLRWRVSDITRYVENANHDLATAWFPTDAVNLREDGLECLNCPSRTGAAAGLFAAEEGERDICLDRACFAAKTAKFVEITREAAPTGAVMVAKYQYGVELPDGVISTNDFAVKSDEDEKCDFLQNAVFFGPRGTGIVQGCLKSSGCKEHHYSNRYGTGSEEKVDPEVAAKAKRVRKEEIWNVKVGEETRQRVLRLCAAEFGSRAMVDALTKGLGASVITRITSATVDHMWATEDYATRKMIVPAIEAAIGDKLPKFEKARWDDEDELTNRVEYIEGLSYENQAKMLFLFTHGHRAAMVTGGSWVDQTPIAELAEEFDVNYQLIDAQVRLEFSTKKFEKVHKAYLQQCEVGDPNRIAPVLFDVEPEQTAEKAPKKGKKAAETVQEPASSEKGTEPSGETEIEPETGDEGGEGADDLVDEDAMLTDDENEEEFDLEPDDEEVPEDTPSLDTSFHDHEMNVGDVPLSIFETCEVCVAMRNSTMFDETEIEDYHNTVISIEDLNPPQQAILRQILELVDGTEPDGGDSDEEADELDAMFDAELEKAQQGE